MHVRYLVLLLFACGGPAYAPVSVVLDRSQVKSDVLVFSASLAANKKLNLNCTANCELGAALPDGGNLWFGLEGGGRDGGVAWGAPQDVAIGSTVELLIVNGDAESHVDTCDVKHDVPPGGFTVTATVKADTSCSFDFR